MTMPQGSTEEPETVFTGLESVPVHVVSTDAKPGKSIAPEFGQWKTVIVSSALGPVSTTPGAQRLLNRSLRRHEARIVVNASIVAQTVTDGVIIGPPAIINSGNPAAIGTMAGFLQVGDSITYKSQQELWVAYPASNAAPVIVTALDMQYASDPESYREEERRS
jgi:hypothetical protein